MTPAIWGQIIAAIVVATGAIIAALLNRESRLSKEHGDARRDIQAQVASFRHDWEMWRVKIDGDFDRILHNLNNARQAIVAVDHEVADGKAACRLTENDAVRFRDASDKINRG